MTRFQPKNPDYRAIAIDTFEQQRAMKTLGISIARLEPGEVDLVDGIFARPHPAERLRSCRDHHRRARQCLRHRRLHADAGGSDILTVEFKTNLLAPARGERFAFRATVVKPGRTLTVCEGRAYAEHDGVETLIATMSGTLMALPRREARRRRTGRHASA